MGNNELIMEMTEYYSGEPHRIQHFMKVFAYAKMMGELEGLGREEQKILETAAIVHDIGIRTSEEMHGDCTGKHQEELGPGVAREMLESLGYEERVVDRVCYLVGHHHTYTNIDGMDYQILVEADFLVNLFEGENNNKPAKATLEKIFKTESGAMLCRAMFATDRDVRWQDVGGYPK